MVPVANRIVWIDIAKAICIILVVIGHYYPETHPVWYGEMRNIIYSFHMPLFMFASGFVYIVTFRNTGYHDFLWKKVKRLMIPYLTVSVMIITIKLLTQGHAYVENPVTLLSYLRIFYLPEAGYFLWFIWALWWMFVIIPFFKTSYSRLLLLLGSLFLPIISDHMPEELCLKQFARMLQYFVAGVVAYDWREYFVWCKRVPYAVITLAFCLLEAMPYIGMGGANSTIIASTGIAFVLKLSYSLEERVKITSWGNVILLISTASYIIYLLHTTFEGFAKAVILRFPYLSNLSDDWAFVIGGTIVVGSGVIIPLLLFKYLIVRYEITRAMFGLK